MARPRKKPDYNPEKLMNELLDIVVDEYKKTFKTIEHKGEIKAISEELEIAPHKVRKLLITAGVRDGREYYNSPSCNQVLSLHKKGKTVAEIMDLTGLNRTSVCCYLPYSKGLYNAKELSVVAERVKKYRKRRERCEGFNRKVAFMKQEQAEEYLWDTLLFLQGCIFYAVSEGNSIRQPFSYRIKEGEMFVGKMTESINKTTVMKAFKKAREIQNVNGFIAGPQDIEEIGAKYYDQAPWRGTWAQDGGCLMNQCIHGIDLLRWMMGDEVEEVYGATRQQFHDYLEAEDVGTAIVKFKNGAVGTIEGTVNVFPRNLEETLYVFGENGTVKIGGTSTNNIDVWEFADATEVDAGLAGMEEATSNVYGNGHTSLFADMISAIRDDRKPYVDAVAGRNAVEMILAIYKSECHQGQYQSKTLQSWRRCISEMMMK